MSELREQAVKQALEIINSMEWYGDWHTVTGAGRVLAKALREHQDELAVERQRLTKLRAALAKYANSERWGETDECILANYWIGEHDDDETPGWRIAEEALREEKT